MQSSKPNYSPEYPRVLRLHEIPVCPICKEPRYRISDTAAQPNEITLRCKRGHRFYVVMEAS